MANEKNKKRANKEQESKGMGNKSPVEILVVLLLVLLITVNIYFVYKIGGLNEKVIGLEEQNKPVGNVPIDVNTTIGVDNSSVVDNSSNTWVAADVDEFIYITSENCELCDNLSSVARELADKLNIPFKEVGFTRELPSPGYILIYNGSFIQFNGIRDEISLEIELCSVTNNEESCDMVNMKMKDANMEAKKCLEGYNISKDTIIFYYSNNCGYCAQMKPIVEKLQNEGYTFYWAETTTGEGMDVVSNCLPNIIQGGVPEFICAGNVNVEVGARSEENLRALADECRLT